ncbi:alpha/beta-hydrolase [Armillaria borealis]|uniref:Alpha/beta-hydrolase n=1 Tax=Armillaria borealis TaxID=47425 RepID=A0AA39JAF2_9AGAR|nr:alpha/beta-hydrolase [Armillaria borealis]
MSIKDLRDISPDILEDLIFYFKYASSAYTPFCPRPNGRNLVTEISNSVSDIQGFIARDGDRKELVLALRGSVSIIDILVDSAIVLVPLITPGVEAPSGVRVHSGFLVGWNSIAIQIIAVIKQQLFLHPDLKSLVTTGHSLGGSLATLAAICLRGNFPSLTTRTYSYGAPRVGNKEFADYFNGEFGVNAFRVVHSNDGVPTMIPTSLGYHHHGVEYWQTEDHPQENSTKQCSPDGEDPRCSASVPSEGVNAAHMTYFGILATTPFCI